MDTQNSTQNQPPLSVDEQKVLNTPLAQSGGMDEKDLAFLNTVMDLISKGTINLYNPSTLINRSVYDGLPTEKRGKIDFEAVNLLSAIREIKNLNDNGFGQTYQMSNLVQRIRVTKERLENEGGDLFII
ncbi:MAG: hypothetical protein WC269_05285 [Candidatus Gracilibacteria bacterium]|jgi:hypothetical protein